jgi:hypothetical protein
MRTRELEVRLVNVLERAWHAPFRTKSDFARLQANYVAVAADRRLLTTLATTKEYGATWLITPEGLLTLWRHRKRLPFTTTNKKGSHT